MKEIELQYIDSKYYTILFDFRKGHAGTYFDPPEEHDLNIYRIYDENGVETKDISILDYFDEEIYDLINYGHFD